MKRSINNMEVKRFNRNRVFRYLNQKDTVSMPEVAAELNMSGPTVLTIINELKAENIVEEVGEYQSTGGRKAKAYSVKHDIFMFLGLDITRNHIGIVCTDLSKKVLYHERLRKVFRYDTTYLHYLGEVVEEFISKNNILESKIKGVGVSVSGIVDAERNCITYSHSLNLERDLYCDELCKYIPYPSYLINDANAGALAECSDNIEKNMAFLSLSNYVGGAIVYKGAMSSPRDNSQYRNMYVGNEWKAGEFGHIVIHPKGKTCYCGKKGCLDAYCSALVLAEKEGGKLEAFFEKLEAGNKEYEKIWVNYLEDLSYAIDTLRMSFDCDVVLGGYVGSMMEPYLETYRNQISINNIFRDSGSFLRICRYKTEAAALGAALSLVEKTISDV